MSGSSCSSFYCPSHKLWLPSILIAAGCHCDSRYGQESGNKDIRCCFLLFVCGHFPQPPSHSLRVFAFNSRGEWVNFCSSEQQRLCGCYPWAFTSLMMCSLCMYIQKYVCFVLVCWLLWAALHEAHSRSFTHASLSATKRDTLLGDCTGRVHSILFIYLYSGNSQHMSSQGTLQKSFQKNRTYMPTNP